MSIIYSRTSTNKAKATNTLNVLKRNLKSTKEVREKAYKSLVRPQVEYAASVWSPWFARDKARIERVQCRAACYVYNTYSRYSSVTAMLQSINWETLESRRFNMHLCIIYKAYYNLAMFPLLDYATPVTVQTWGNNIKFILPHCSKDMFKTLFPTCYTQRLECPPTISSGGYILGIVQGQPPRCYILMLHQTVFILHWVVVLLLNAHFLYYFSFLPITSHRQYWRLVINGR